MSGLASLIKGAGFAPGTPVTLARCDATGAIEAACGGVWSNGQPVVASDRFYGASLAKQVTGAAAALLVRDGKLDPDRSIAVYLNDLPPWAAGIKARHLAHHLSGLPAAGALEAAAPADWTGDFAFASLHALPRLAAQPGAVHAYSNLGYILLAQVVERVADVPFSAFVSSRLLAPLDIQDMGFAAEVEAFSQTRHMGQRLPLTQGDGGLWSTSRAFAAWLHRQNQDALHIAGIVEAPGHLTDGTEVAYGWGIGLRAYRGHRLLIHGGSWTGAIAKAVRCPGLGLAVVAMAAGGSSEALGRLVEAALDGG